MKLKITAILVLLFMTVSVVVTAMAMTLKEELLVNLKWQWNNAPIECVDAVKLHANGKNDEALGKLKHGQRHNAHVQEVYRVAYLTLPDFWEIVITASDSSPDLDVASINIDWQFNKELGGLRDVYKYYNDGETYKAMATMLYYQRHNVSTMNNYRACFGHKKVEFFNIVNRYFK